MQIIPFASLLFLKYALNVSALWETAPACLLTCFVLRCSVELLDNRRGNTPHRPICDNCEANAQPIAMSLYVPVLIPSDFLVSLITVRTLHAIFILRRVFLLFRESILQFPIDLSTSNYLKKSNMEKSNTPQS